MSFMKSSQDELLDGFCRGCLKKYCDPAELLHYTEKNRRLFIYSTGIQVKRNDTFTFQICKECYTSMKVSCKFKKQCRTSDRRFKSFLRMKELGDGPDLPTFLKYSDEQFKFPLLSGQSTPATQKNKEDDNESVCTSIRNFMTDILQGEEMPDNEATIIKQVIEEEADLLDDSLDSHWLLDESNDFDSRLDFSFSPYVTPHSTINDHCFTPIKQLEPSLRCKNNHAKRVFQQLPTTHIDHDNALNIFHPHESILPSSDLNQIEKEGIIEESGDNITTKNDSITELINENEDFILNQKHHGNKNRSTNFEIDSGPMKRDQQIDIQSIKSLDLNTLETDSQDESINEFPPSQNKIAAKNLNFYTLKTLPDDCTNDLPVQQVDLSAFETEFHLNKNNTDITEKDIAVKKITRNTFGIDSKTQETKAPLVENNLLMETSNYENVDIESEYILNNVNKSTVADEVSSIKRLSVNIESKPIHKRHKFPLTECDLAVKSILEIDPPDDVYSYSVKDNQTIAPMVTKINVLNIEKSPVDEICLENTSIDDKSFEENDNEAMCDNHENIRVVVEEIMDDTVVNQNQADDPLLISNILEDQIAISQKITDTIDKNLEEAINNNDSESINLDDLLVSPARVYSKANARIISTPTINNILFGEKLDDDSNPPLETIKEEVDQENGEIDVLEEFFKEGVKEFEGKEYNPELPLELKYDLKTNTCKMCPKTFATLVGLKVHLAIRHSIKFPKIRNHVRPPQVCKHCGVLVPDSRNFARHIKRHYFEKMKSLKQFKCEYCSLPFLDESKYKMHMKIHEPNKTVLKDEKPKKYVCDQCGASFKNSSNLNVHMRRHTTDYYYKCEICEQGFHRAWDLNLHIKRRHTGERPFNCPQCGKSFTTKHLLAQHVVTHYDKPFECHHCSLKFRTKLAITKHILGSKRCKTKTNIKKKVIKNERKFECSNCHAKFITHYNLVRHKNLTICGKSTYNSPTNNLEVIVYDGVLPPDVTFENDLECYK